MSGVMDTLISGIVKSAMNELLKKTGIRTTTTKRTKRKAKSASSTTTSRSKSRKAGPVSGSSGSGARAVTPAKKQVSKRRTSSARSKAKR